MSSEFDTPGDIIWVSNGVVEEVERWCVERTRALRLYATPAGRALVEFMQYKINSSGPGMYGFSVTKPPFDAPICRRLLARLIDDLAHEIAESATTPMARWSFLRNPDYPWLYSFWLGVMERLHAGIVRSFAPSDAPAPLALDLSVPLRAAVEWSRWMPIWQELRRFREEPSRWRRPADPTAELAALEHLIAAMSNAPAAYRRPSSEEPTPQALLASRADLLEMLGRRTDAAAAWREVAAAETDAGAIATALEIAARLDRSAT